MKIPAEIDSVCIDIIRRTIYGVCMHSLRVGKNAVSN